LQGRRTPPPSASPSPSLCSYKTWVPPLFPPFRSRLHFSPRPSTTPTQRRRLCFPPPLEKLTTGEGLSFSLSSLFHVLRRRSSNSPCSRTPSSSPCGAAPLSARAPPEFAVATELYHHSAPPSVFSAVASL
jgi:hypothetical protein